LMDPELESRGFRQSDWAPKWGPRGLEFPKGIVVLRLNAFAGPHSRVHLGNNATF